MSKPDRIYLYRITHIDNLNFILQSRKLTCPNSPFHDPNYTGIGDETLINSRSSKKVNIQPKGNFKDYVAFYFGPRSPMLYSIQKGFNGVTKRAPETIIYMVTTFENIKETGKQYVFSDGHGYHLMSQFFNEENKLDEVDWDIVFLNHWNDTEDDSDRKRRKQAEFLVHGEIPLSAIVGIGVYNESAKTNILAKFEEHNFKCNVIVKSDLYY